MSNAENLKKDVQIVIQDIEEILAATKDDVSEKAVALRAKMQARINDLRLQLPEIRDQVVQRTKEGCRVVDETIQDNPWKAVGIAAVTGIVLGALIARK